MLKHFLSTVVAVSLVCSGEAVLAQMTTATISGTVRDQTGAVLPGATVTLTQAATARTRAEVSDGQGRYRASNLPLGAWEVRAELAGFQTSIRKGIELTVGREALVDMALNVGDVSEALVVTAEVPLVDTTATGMSGVVNEQRIRELPLNGRDLTQLLTLETGVTQVRQGTPGATGGFGSRISVSGARPEMLGWLLDGTDVQTPYRTGPSGAAGVQLGVEAVQEFRILTNSYSAEYGSVGGGLVNSVTKSGTNAFSGSAFGFLRNSALDARNYFDQGAKPPFTRYQFGGSLGGPILKSRTFFFTAYEGLRQRLTTTQIANVPTAAARQGILPGRTPVRVEPTIAKLLPLFPLPNGRDFGNGTAEFSSTGDRPVDEHFVTVRLDHSFNGNYSLYGRFTSDTAKKTTPEPLHVLANPSDTRHRSATIEQTNILGSHWLNKVRFGYALAFDSDDWGAAASDISAIMLTPFPYPANFSVPGLTSLGLNVTIPAVFDQNQVEIASDMTYSAGAHSLKFGGSFKRYWLFINQQNRMGGQWLFNSFPDFLEGRVNSFNSLVPGTDGIRDVRQNVVGFFAQDSIAVSPRVTLNLGLRYEFITVPFEVTGKNGSLRNAMDPEATVGPFFANPSLKNFAPRVGVAWDPYGDGKTSIRFGAGVFYDQVLSNYWINQITHMPPFNIRGQIQNPPMTGTYEAMVRSGRASPQVWSIDYNAHTPRLTQYNVSAQRQFGSSIAAQVGYIGSHGNNLPRVGEANTAIPVICSASARNCPAGIPDGAQYWAAGLRTRNPNFSSDRREVFDGVSSYNGLALGFTKRFSGASQLQASYTLAKGLDEGSSSYATALRSGDFQSIDFYDHTRNRGLSSFDIRHAFVLNYSWDLPVHGTVLGGWQLGGIWTLQSGNPQTPSLGFNNSRNLSTSNMFEVPSLKEGATNNPVLGGPVQYYDPSVFVLAPAGTLGNLGRNTAIGPGVGVIDLSLTKKATLPLAGGRSALQFRAEVFNILNRVNFALPNVQNVLLQGGAPNPSFARIIATSTTSRQIQLGVKLLW